MTRLRVEESQGRGSEWAYTFPPEMMAEAAQRLGWLGLIYSATGLVGHFGRRLATAWSSGVAFEPASRTLSASSPWRWVSRSTRIARSGALSNRGLVNLAMTFLVAGAFGLSIREFWDGVPAGVDSAFP